jgi:hypothetical protein
MGPLVAFCQLLVMVFRNGRSVSARLMGLMQPEPGPITPRALLEVAIGNQKPCHQQLALPASTRASAVKFLRWRFADQVYVNCRVNHGIITVFNRPHFQPLGNADHQKYRSGLHDLDSRSDPPPTCFGGFIPEIRPVY